MLDKNMIEKLFHDVNEELKDRETKGEILIVGGAVMCVVYLSRHSTKDVDGVFAPTAILRDIIEIVGEKNGLESDWLNDGAKGYVNENIEKDVYLILSNLTVWSPVPEYLLAMKCLSSRADSYDAEDIRFLLTHLGIKEWKEVEGILKKYYPDNLVPPKTMYFVQEILEEM